MRKNVRNQAELDAALKAGDYPICIGNEYFVLRGNSHAVLRGNSHAELWENSHAELRGNSHAVLRGNSHAVLRENSHAELWENSHAELRENSHAELRENSHAVLRENSHAKAFGTSHITAYGGSVVASKMVAIHRHSKDASIKGGVVIDVKQPTNEQEWCDFYGASVKRGVAYLFKAVDDNYKSGYDFEYKPGTKPKAPDWDGGKAECGGGLHFCATPLYAREFFGEAKRFVCCPVRLNEIVVHKEMQHPTKIKAPRVCGKIFEVDIYGKRLKLAK